VSERREREWERERDAIESLHEPKHIFSTDSKPLHTR
jgi:hypothetical protein